MEKKSEKTQKQSLISEQQIKKIYHAEIQVLYYTNKKIVNKGSCDYNSKNDQNIMTNTELYRMVIITLVLHGCSFSTHNSSKREIYYWK